MEEEWRDIAGWEGIYQVSNLGRVRRLISRGGKILEVPTILSPTADKLGYKRVPLHRNKRFKVMLVHRLVAIAFLPNPNNYSDINHKDENPSNNVVTNIEWCSRQYNLNYGHHNEKMKETLKVVFKNRKDLSKPVIQLSKDGKEICRYPSISEASRQTGIDISNISVCLSGKVKQTHGYVWRFA